MLVDTSVWVDYFNGYSSPQSDYLANAINAAAPIVIPGVVLTEILLGLRSEADASRIVDLLSVYDPAPSLDRDDYIEAAVIYRQCRSRGYTVRSTIDCLIAQICLRNELSLLSKDRDFKAIAHCLPLNIINTAKNI